MSSDFKPETKPIEQVPVKKSRKKIVVISAVVILLVVASALFVSGVIDVTSVKLNPASSKLKPTDFPLELFAQGYDELCQTSNEGFVSCVIRNDGKIELSHQNGIYKFQTKDYSLLKYFSDETGYEEKSISSAFYDQTTMARVVESGGQSMWLVTAK